VRRAAPRIRPRKIRKCGARWKPVARHSKSQRRRLKGRNVFCVKLRNWATFPAHLSRARAVKRKGRRNLTAAAAVRYRSVITPTAAPTVVLLEEGHGVGLMPNTSVLVVEDNPLSRASAIEIFRELGFFVFGAYCADDALDALNAHPSISVLFIDVRLPGMSGTDLAQVVRRKHPEIKIVLTSGVVTKDGVPRDFPFVAKPWRPNEIIQALA
jgi:CheY-like chemotaxis protein